ncbi:CCR4-Not complex subunit [Plasmodium cynomolgi strain B]|uniref:CCR4-Not complex subunit n=1 Tax=Plasmodium cynomolgi (strain B) TaxID=1120755 RepID=K6UJX3_PLACD|nr:CCR4-Not complex subunit [Plasmodium cynomolgi strain B]GAB66323.1 CCR4-Not complex subunit [Plasmodium cynomolgi strain B]
MNNNFNINVQVDNAFLSEHEVEVNGYFAKLYTGEITVDTMIDIMKSLSCSPKGSKNNDVYKSMLLILFNECRFFPKYPSEELDTTAQLFGKLIKHNLLLSYGNTLAVALKCILEAFKKGNDSKMFNFGITALEQFEDSLICYPSFLSSLIAVTTLRQYNPQYVIHCSNLLNTLPEHFRSLPYIDASTILKIKHLAEIGANSSTTDANMSQASNDDVKKISTHNANNLKNVNNLISSMGITMGSGLVDNTNVSNNLSGASSCTSNNNNSAIANALNSMLKGNSSNSANLTNDNVLSYISDILPNNSSLNQNITTNVNLLNGDKPSTPFGAMNQLYANRSYVSPSGSNQINRILTTQGNTLNLGGREIVSLSHASILNEHAGEIGMSTVVDGSKYASTPEGIKRPNVNLNADKGDGMGIGNNLASGNPLSGRDKEEQLGQIMESFYDRVQVKLPPNLSLNNIGGFGLGQIECLMDNTDLTKNIIVPSSVIIGEVFSIFNTLCSFNIDEKIKILKEVMQPEHYSWLAFYIVKSRASKEVNLHEVFLEFIDKLSYPMLIDTIINMTYDCILILFKYINELKEVSAFKTVLKNLGSWLGFITLGRNRPLKSKILDLKLVLFEAYEKECLVCILPMVCRILESIKLSKNFKPPNPWTTTMLCLLTEIHELPNVKTYTIFEVEILFKNLALDIHAFQNKTTLLSKRSVAQNRKSELLMPKGGNNNQENTTALPVIEDLKNLPRREGLTSVINSHIGRVEGGLTLNPRLEELENATNITTRDIPSSVPNNARPSSRFIPEKVEYTRRNNNLPSYNVDYVDSEWSKDDADRIDALTNDMTLVSTFPPPDINLINASYHKKVAGSGGKNVNAMGEQYAPNVSYATSANYDGSASYIGSANYYDNNADYYDNGADYYDGTANYYDSNDNMDAPDISIDNNLINNKINSSKFLQSLNSAVIISPSIALFQIQPGLKSLVTIAFYQAIREIIAAILDRSVAISCVTTREIVCKDFCLERDETLIRKAAHIMISSLAGSLALVTCKEPLRISLTHHLRHWLEKTSTKDCNDQVLIEQVVQILSADNLELGCSLVEQAVIEKAIKDINEALEPTLLSRQVAKENRIPLNDPIHLMNTKRMQLEIAHSLKLASPVTNNQLQIYKDFLNIAPLKKLHAAAKALTKIYTKVNDVNVENNQQGGGTLMHALFSNSNLQKKEEKMDYPKNMNEEKRTVNEPAIGMPKSDPTVARKANTDYNINGGIKTEQSVNSAKRNANENTPPRSSSPSAAPLATNSQLHKILNKLELATNQLKDAVKDILILPPILFNINKEKPSDNINKMSLHILYSLSVDGSIFNLIKSIPEIAALTQQKNETIISYSNRIFKFLFEVIPPNSNKTPWVYRSNDPSGIYLEVFLCILEKLKKKCPSLKEHITDFIMSDDSSSPSNDNSPSCSKSLFSASNLVKEKESDDVTTKLGSEFSSPTNSNSNQDGRQNKNESEAKSHNKGVPKLNANVIAGFIRYNLVDMEKYKYYLVRQLSTDMYNINTNAEFVTLLLKKILIDFQIFRYNDFENIFIILNNLKEQNILTNKIIFFNDSPPIDTNVAIELLTEEAKKIQGKKDAVIFSDLLHVYEEYLKSDDEHDEEQDQAVLRDADTDQMMLRMGMERNVTDAESKKGQLQGNQVQNGRNSQNSQHAQGESEARGEDGLYYSNETVKGREAKENTLELKCTRTNNNFHLNEIKKSELLKNPLEYFKRDYNQLSEDLLSALIEEQNFDKIQDELKSVDNFGLLDMEGVKVHTGEDARLSEKDEKAKSALSTRTSTNNKSNVDGIAISKTNQENRANAELCHSKRQAKREYKKNLKILMDPEHITTLTQIIDFCLNTDWNILQKKKIINISKTKGWEASE